MSSLPGKTKFILGSSVLGLLVVVTIILNVTIANKTGRFQQEYQQLENTLKQVLSRTGDITDVKTQHEQQLTHLVENSDRYMTELGYLKDLQTLKNRATRYDVEVTELIPKLEDTMPALKQYISITENYLERYEIELALRGKLRNVGRFIQYLDTDNRRIYIKGISINPVDMSSVEAKIRAYSYGLRQL
jgi:cell division protein FtsI/penicillin-binding protein 2